LSITEVGLHGCSIGVEVKLEVCKCFVVWGANDRWDCWVRKTRDDAVQRCCHCCCWLAFKRLGVAFEWLLFGEN
jgi:hypothetical protein